jgi:hypothetical protein
MRLKAPGAATQGGCTPDGEHDPDEDKTSFPLVLIAYTKWTADGLGDGPTIGWATGR